MTPKEVGIVLQSANSCTVNFNDKICEADYMDKTNHDEAQKKIYIRERLEYRPNFLTYEECERIIEVASDQFERSMITTDGKQHVVSNYRTSYSAFLHDIDPLFKSQILNKGKSLLSRRQYTEFENIQCVSYTAGQEFRAHFDSGTDLQRRYTILVYLNDEFEGGGTHFPMLGLTIKPERGKAVLFQNLDDAGHVDIYSFHAGLPVGYGKKFACNIWVR
jgi:prolyl 4-hydroxylase